MKRYDTETAELVYDWNNGWSEYSSHYRGRKLYRTHLGSWVLVNEGQRDTTTLVTKIKLLTDDEAYEILEWHGKDEKLDLYFADKKGGGK